jgi:hypothetical protein
MAKDDRMEEREKLNRRFERRLEGVQGKSWFHGALIDVLDTAEFCKQWFEKEDMAPSDLAIVQMTGLVMEREAVLRQRSKDEDDGETRE